MKGRNLIIKIIILTVLAFFLTGCESDSESTLSYTTIEINQEYPATIESYGSKVYKVKITASGNYVIGIKNLGSDCGITVCDYVSGAETLEDLIPAIIIDIDDYDDNTDEISTENLSSGEYFLVVDEYDDMGDSNYTLFVYDEATYASLKSIKIYDVKSTKEKSSIKKIEDKWSSFN